MAGKAGLTVVTFLSTDNPVFTDYPKCNPLTQIILFWVLLKWPDLCGDAGIFTKMLKVDLMNPGLPSDVSLQGKSKVERRIKCGVNYLKINHELALRSIQNLFSVIRPVPV